MRMTPVRLLTLSLALVSTTTLAVTDLHAGPPTGMTPQQMEEAGIDTSVAPAKPSIPLKALPSGPVLLIPDSSADVVAMFDPFDGKYLGDLINGSGVWSTPINAVQGPNGNIFLSDQVTDTVYEYDVNGLLVQIWGDSTDGLNNIRGIDFAPNGDLYVSSATEVSVFTAPHTRVADYVTGSSFFDVLFRKDGSTLLVDITTDYIDHYDPAGTFLGNVLYVDFCEQVQDDTLLPGEYIEASFSEKSIKDFDMTGTVHQTTALSTYGRGTYRLGNGNLLASGSIGVQEIDPATGTVITQIMTGSSWRFIEGANMSDWTDLGNDLPGSLGSPVLDAMGPLVGGGSVTVDLSNALPNSIAHLIVGLSAIDAPFMGGTLVPFPNIIVSIPTGTLGAFSLPATLPPTIPAGIPIYLQFWVADISGPVGLTASNAITSTTK